MKCQCLFAAVSACLLAVSLSACAAGKSSTQETVVDFTDGDTHFEMYRFYNEEFFENRNGWTMITYQLSKEYSTPGFTVETASGEFSTVEGTTARGNLKVLLGKTNKLGVAPDATEWAYIIPASRSYIITPRGADIYQVKLSLTGYLGEEGAVLDSFGVTQYFEVEGIGLQKIEYQDALFWLSGEDMEYKFGIPGRFQENWGNVDIFGTGETQLNVRRDGEDLLLCSESAPCSVQVTFNKPEGNGQVELNLGECAAGQWYRIVYQGENTVLKEEPKAPLD